MKMSDDFYAALNKQRTATQLREASTRRAQAELLSKLHKQACDLASRMMELERIVGFPSRVARLADKACRRAERRFDKATEYDRVTGAQA